MNSARANRRDTEVVQIIYCGPINRKSLLSRGARTASVRLNDNTGKPVGNFEVGYTVNSTGGASLPARRSNGSMRRFK